ncbi:hypothetical protein HDK77DRAFT_21294 [Phyllosticta capitalensis]
MNIQYTQAKAGGADVTQRSAGNTVPRRPPFERLFQTMHISQSRPSCNSQDGQEAMRLCSLAGLRRSPPPTTTRSFGDPPRFSTHLPDPKARGRTDGRVDGPGEHRRQTLTSSTDARTGPGRMKTSLSNNEHDADAGIGVLRAVGSTSLKCRIHLLTLLLDRDCGRDHPWLVLSACAYFFFSLSRDRLLIAACLIRMIRHAQCYERAGKSGASTNYTRDIEICWRKFSFYDIPLIF